MLKASVGNHIERLSLLTYTLQLMIMSFESCRDDMIKIEQAVCDSKQLDESVSPPIFAKTIENVIMSIDLEGVICWS